MIQKLLQKLRTLGREGLFHIFGFSVFAKIGGLISSVVVIRDLPKVAYGSFVDANNLFSYFAAFVGLGMHNAVMQYCSEKITEDHRSAIYGYTFKTGMLGNFLLSAGILILAALRYHSGKETTGIYLALMCLLPFFSYADHYFQIIFRVKLNNAAFSRTNMINVIAHVSGNILLTLLWGVPGLIASLYLSHLIAALYSYRMLRKEGLFRSIAATPVTLQPQQKKEYTSYALTYALTTFASAVLVLLDVTCLGLVLGEAEILADYKVAATIPAACAFIPASLTVFFYPKMVRAFSEGVHRGKQLLKQLAWLYFGVNGVICICLEIFAPLIIWLVFGEKYSNIVPIFRILTVNFLLSSMRNLTSHTFAVLKKVKANLAFSIISGLLNIGLNLLLIPRLGSPGAAYATVIVTGVILLMNVVYLHKYLKEE